MEMLAQNGLSRERSGIRVIAKAETPHGPAGPKRLTLTLAAFASTLALAIALALLLERDAVSSARKDYVQRRLACHHVASLPTYSRDPAEITPRGARLVLNAPDGRYASAVHEIETEIKRRRSHDASRAIRGRLGLAARRGRRIGVEPSIRWRSREALRSSSMPICNSSPSLGCSHRKPLGPPRSDRGTTSDRRSNPARPDDRPVLPAGLRPRPHLSQCRARYAHRSLPRP